MHETSNSSGASSDLLKFTSHISEPTHNAQVTHIEYVNRHVNQTATNSIEMSVIKSGDSDLTDYVTKLRNFNPADYTSEELRQLKSNLQNERVGEVKKIPVTLRIFAVFSKSLRHQVIDTDRANTRVQLNLIELGWEDVKKSALKKIDVRLGELDETTGKLASLTQNINDLPDNSILRETFLASVHDSTGDPLNFEKTYRENLSKMTGLLSPLPSKNPQRSKEFARIAEEYLSDENKQSSFIGNEMIKIASTYSSHVSADELMPVLIDFLQENRNNPELLFKITTYQPPEFGEDAYYHISIFTALTFLTNEASPPHSEPEFLTESSRSELERDLSFDANELTHVRQELLQIDHLLATTPSLLESVMSEQLAIVTEHLMNLRKVAQERNLDSGMAREIDLIISDCNKLRDFLLSTPLERPSIFAELSPANRPSILSSEDFVNPSITLQVSRDALYHAIDFSEFMQAIRTIAKGKPTEIDFMLLRKLSNKPFFLDFLKQQPTDFKEMAYIILQNKDLSDFYKREYPVNYNVLFQASKEHTRELLETFYPISGNSLNPVNEKLNEISREQIDAVPDKKPVVKLQAIVRQTLDITHRLISLIKKDSAPSAVSEIPLDNRNWNEILDPINSFPERIGIVENDIRKIVKELSLNFENKSPFILQGYSSRLEHNLAVLRETKQNLQNAGFSEELEQEQRFQIEVLEATCLSVQGSIDTEQPIHDAILALFS